MNSFTFVQLRVLNYCFIKCFHYSSRTEIVYKTCQIVNEVSIKNKKRVLKGINESRKLQET